MSVPPGVGAAHPHVLSFRPRRGRVTLRQQSALDQSWGAYGLDVPVPGEGPPPVPVDLPALFGRTAPVVLEIGFGMGEATAAMAVADPSRDLLAVDVHTPGVGALLHLVGDLGLTHVRVARGDALVLLRDMLGPASLDEIRVFFPDPWPKQRHHKRRLVRPGFAALAASRLVPGGRLHLATDWDPYALQMLGVVDAEPLLHNLHDGPAPRPAHRPLTRFERHGLAKGHHVTDVIVVRTGG